MEIRFRLNDKSEKDLIIIEFLAGEYSPAETIKAILYKMATNVNKGMQVSFVGNVANVNISNDIPQNDDIGKLTDITPQENTPQIDALGIDDELAAFFN